MSDFCPPDLVFFFQAEDGIRDWSVTGVQTCALPIFLQPLHVVDGVVEIDVHVVGAEPSEAPLQRAHHRVPAVARARVGLRREVDPVARAAQDVPDERLRVAAAVAVCRVEVVDALIERVPDGISLTGAQAATPERDVGYPHAGAAERRVALHPRLGASRRLGRRPEWTNAQSEGGERAPLQELAAIHVESSSPTDGTGCRASCPARSRYDRSSCERPSAPSRTR